MNAQQFLASFGHIANAPRGIDRLRELVLELAVQGRLTPNIDEQESAEALLSEINAWHNERLSKSRNGRARRSHSPVNQREKPFRAPRSWIWVCNSDLFGLTKGRNPKDLNAQSGKYAYLDVEALDRGTILRYSSDENAPRSTEADILVVCDGSRSGLILRGRDGIIGSTLARIDTPKIIQPFVELLFRRNYRQFNSEKKGAAIPHLDTARLLSEACALPPLQIQQEIVAKVDELMAVCDQLEQLHLDRRRMQNTLRKSTLQALADAHSRHDLYTSWKRLHASLGDLFQEHGDLEALRGMILDLAFLGKLSDAQPGDESPEQLLKRSREAKERRLAIGDMKRRVAPATDVVQLDVELPEHWSRAPLDELFQFIDYRGKTPNKTDSGVVLVTAKNVRPGRLEREPIEYISEKSYAEWMTRGFPKVGDILITTEAPLGNVALIDCQPSFALAQRVIDLQPFADMNTRCAMYFMMCPTFQAILNENSSGMAAKGIKAGKLKQLELPLPPLSEQARIVDRVDKMMLLCIDLEGKLRDSERAANRLATASVANLAGIDIDENKDTAVKAPQTELIAPLRLATPPDVKSQAPLATILARHHGEVAARDLWQRFGGDIDTFYAQLKTEVSNGWIAEPEIAQVREKPTTEAGVA